MPSRPTLSLALLAAAACGDGDPPATAPVPVPASSAAVHEHDFGTIPHGKVRSHVFDLGLPPGAVGLAPAGFQSPCSCGSADFRIVTPDGVVHDVETLAVEQRVLREGCRLQMVLTLDTAQKESTDHPRTTTTGDVLLRDPNDFFATVRIAIVFHYAIDAPVAVLPAPHVAVGEIAASQTFSQYVELHPDRPEPPVAFGPIEIADPRVRAEFRDSEGPTLLEIGFEPGAHPVPGPFHSIVRIGTDLDGYQVEIAVSGEIVPDITIDPYDHVSFGRFDMSRPAERFVRVQDRDRSRPAGFEVVDITAQDGTPLDGWFEVTPQPIDGEPRASRLTLRYLGGVEGRGFRGVVRLAKPGGLPPVTPLTFVGFQRDS